MEKKLPKYCIKNKIITIKNILERVSCNYQTQVNQNTFIHLFKAMCIKSRNPPILKHTKRCHIFGSHVCKHPIHNKLTRERLVWIQEIIVRSPFQIVTIGVLECNFWPKGNKGKLLQKGAERKKKGEGVSYTLHLLLLSF